MIPELRRQFNQRWSAQAYAELLAGIQRTAGIHVPFRCCETPVFLPSPLLEKMVRYGQELYHQLLNNAAYAKASAAAIPPAFRVPNETAHSLFLQADFGLVKTAEGHLEPMLVELQGFPSIYGFQAAMAGEYLAAFHLREGYPPAELRFSVGWIAAVMRLNCVKQFSTDMLPNKWSCSK